MSEKFLLVTESFNDIKAVDIDSSDSHLLLSGFYDLIGCDSVELIGISVPSLDGGSPVPLLGLVDEEGLFHDRIMNPFASLLYGGPIVGPLILGKSGFHDDEPDIVGFTDSDLDDLRKVFSDLVEFFPLCHDVKIRF